MAPRRPIKLATKKEPRRVLSPVNSNPKVDPYRSEVSFEYFRGDPSNTPPRVFVPSDDTVHKSRDGTVVPMVVLMAKMKNPSKSVAEAYFSKEDDDFGDAEDWAAELEAWLAESKGSSLKQDADFDHWMAKAHYEVDQHFERKMTSLNGSSICSVSFAGSNSRTPLYTPFNVQTIFKKGSTMDQLMDCLRSLKKDMRSLNAAMRTIQAGVPTSRQWISAMALKNLKESLATLYDDVVMCGRSINDLMKLLKNVESGMPTKREKKSTIITTSRRKLAVRKLGLHLCRKNLALERVSWFLLLKVPSASNSFKTDEPWKGNDEVQTTIKLSKDIIITIHKLNPRMQIVSASIAENGCKTENKMSTLKLNSLKKELADLHPHTSKCIKLLTDLMHKKPFCPESPYCFLAGV